MSKSAMIHNINRSVHLFTQVSPINHEFLAAQLRASTTCRDESAESRKDVSLVYFQKGP
jgi:hypothetical protein